MKNPLEPNFQDAILRESRKRIFCVTLCFAVCCASVLGGVLPLGAVLCFWLLGCLVLLLGRLMKVHHKIDRFYISDPNL